MKKQLIFAAATIIGVAGGLYLATERVGSPASNVAVTAPADLDLSAYEAMREGDMLKLQFGGNRGSVVPFVSEDGEEMTLAAFEGEWVILNFWATWCAPCRKEMPHLSELQDEFASEDFEVVTVATGVNQRPAMERFLAEIGVDNLPLHTDANSALARDFGVVGLPVTIVLHPEGYEVARLIGDADWASDNAKGILRAVMARYCNSMRCHIHHRPTLCQWWPQNERLDHAHRSLIFARLVSIDHVRNTVDRC